MPCLVVEASVQGREALALFPSITCQLASCQHESSNNNLLTNLRRRQSGWPSKNKKQMVCLCVWFALLCACMLLACTFPHALARRAASRPDRPAEPGVLACPPSPPLPPVVMASLPGTPYTSRSSHGVVPAMPGGLCASANKQTNKQVLSTKCQVPSTKY